MNTESATGVQRTSLDEIYDSGAAGDWYIDDERGGIWLIIPGFGLTFWTYRDRQSNGALWQWNNSYDAPTLSPSLHLVGEWHGWLREGKLISC